MRNILIATIILPLLGTAALAQSTRSGGDNAAAAAGALSWPNAADQWATLSEPAQSASNAALSGKTKHLIGLAVAARIPCSECVRVHVVAARANGATDAEIREVLSLTSTPTSVGIMSDSVE